MPVSSRFARKVPSIRPTVGKFWTPEKPSLGSSRRKTRMSRNGSVPQTPASTGVSARSAAPRRPSRPRSRWRRRRAGARERAAPGHPVAARVVDDDQVGAARLGALGREAGAGAGADDRPARLDLGAQPGEGLVAGHRALAHELVQAVGHRLANVGVVDVRVELAHVDESSRPSRSAPTSASSAAGSWKGWPLDGDHRDAAQRDEERQTGPVAAFSLRAIRRPSSAHSSGVVRMSVTVGLCS